MSQAFSGQRSVEADRATRKARRVYTHTRIPRTVDDRGRHAGINFRTQGARLPLRHPERVHAAGHREVVVDQETFTTRGHRGSQGKYRLKDFLSIKSAVMLCNIKKF